MRVVGLWVPDEIHDAWVNKIPRERKRVITLAFVELVRKHASIKIDVKQEQSTTIYNVVMPHIEVKPVIKNENRNEVQGVQGDPEVTKEYVKSLERQLKRAKTVIKERNAVIRELEAKLKDFESLKAKLRKYAEEVNALRSQLSKCREEGVAEGIRRAKAKVYELLKLNKITRQAAFTILNELEGVA